MIQLLSPFKSISLAVIENTINALIEDHPWSHAQLSELNGKIIHLEVETLKQIAEIRIVQGFIELGDPGNVGPHAHLSAPLATWISILQSKGANLSGKGVAVKGDIFVFASLNDVWRNEEWSPELVLAPLLGHAGAYLAGKIGKSLLNGLKYHTATANRQTGDFVSNEQTTLVTRRHFEQFQRENRALRDDADRLQIKIDALTQRTTQQSE